MVPKSVVIMDSFASVVGGATRVAVDETVGLASAGVSATFLAAVGPVSDDLMASNVRTVCLNQDRLTDVRGAPSIALHSLWNIRAYDATRRLLNECNPSDTIVHVHGFAQTISASPIRCAVSRGFKVVLTLHDYLAVCPNGVFFDYPSASVCERTPLSMSCVAHNCDKRHYAHKLFRVVKTQAQRLLCDLPGAVGHYIGLSHSSVERIRPYLPSNSKYYFLRNPCTVPKQAPVTAGRSGIVAVIGRLSAEKGIDNIVAAGKLAGVPLLFIGDGPMRVVAEGGGRNRVTGWLQRDEVFRHLEAVRCVVFPSLWPETYGLSVMDAAARGVPSIVSNIAGIAEWIEDGRTGWQTPVGDVGALAARLESTKSDSVVSSVGHAAYTKYWQAPLTLEDHVRELIEIYRDVLT